VPDSALSTQWNIPKQKSRRYEKQSGRIFGLKSASGPKTNALQHTKKTQVLFAAERVAVGTFNHSRVGFMGTDVNAVEGAVIFIAAVVSALGDGAVDAGISFAVTISHNKRPPFLEVR